MKIIIGISSITLIGIFYSIIKNFFSPKKLIEGNNNQTNQQIVTRNNNSKIVEGFSYQEEHSLIRTFDEMKRHLNNNNIKLNGIESNLTEFKNLIKNIEFENLFPNFIRKTICHLSTIDHTDGVSSNPHTFDLSNDDHSGVRVFNKVINIKLLSAQIPYSPINIYSEDSNNILYITKDLTEYNITIPVGYYTITSLMIAINSGLSGAGISDLNFTFDDTTKKISVNNSGGDTYILQINKSPLFKRLGCTVKINNTLIYGYTIIIFSNIPDLSIHYIDILMDPLNERSSELSFNHSNILKRIPLNGAPGDMIYYDIPESNYLSQQNFRTDVVTDNISSIEITLHRHDYSLYNLNGLHYDLKLEITEMVDPRHFNELDTHGDIHDRTRNEYIDQLGLGE